MKRLESNNNNLLTRFEHIPEIKEKCQEVSDIIDSNGGEDWPIFCNILEYLIGRYTKLALYYLEKRAEAQEFIELLVSHILAHFYCSVSNGLLTLYYNTFDCLAEKPLHSI
jgi:hypothetical protein